MASPISRQKFFGSCHNYSFVEDPSRLIAPTRFAAASTGLWRKRTQQRFDSARENKYIEHISKSAIGHGNRATGARRRSADLVRALGERRVPESSASALGRAKVDTNGLTQADETRQQIVDLGYTVDPSAAVMHF